MKVICSHRKTCSEAYQCGGASPHDPQEDECGKCPFHYDAVCEPVEMDETHTTEVKTNDK